MDNESSRNHHAEQDAIVRDEALEEGLWGSPLGVRTPHGGVRRAIQWLRENELPSGGVRVHEKHPRAYPEVTGYLVPTMMAYGERAMARRCVEWLVSVQEPDGSYWDADRRRSYIFDTGQVVRGLLAGSDVVSGAQHAAKRACDWLCRQLVDGGRRGFPREYDGKHHIPESIQLHILPVLLQAGDCFGDPSYREAAERCLDFYLRVDGTLDVDTTLTHFLAYEIEALIELGRVDVAERALEELHSLQRPDGSLRAIGGAEWICIPGLIQIAVCWYRTGRYQAADAALKWAEQHQEASGGFRGSLGPGAWYFATNEPAWAAKYYLDANIWRASSKRYAGELAGGLP